MDRTDCDTVLTSLKESLDYIRIYQRPIVVLDVDALSKINRLFLVLKNCGTTPAFNISCTFNPDLPYARDKKISDIKLFNNLHFLEQGKGLKLFYDSYIEIVEKNYPTQFSVNIHYEDIKGNKYDNEYFIDLLIYKNILMTEDKGLNELVKEVESLRRDISTGFRNLNFDLIRQLEHINANLFDNARIKNEQTEPNE